MFKIIGVITARMESQRLPGKVLTPLAGMSSLAHHIERLKAVEGLADIYVATSKSEANKPLINEALKYDVKVYVGEEEDVVERYIGIGEKEQADALLRTGCDKPLFSFEIATKLVKVYDGEDFLTVANKLGSGVGSEIISVKALQQVHKHYKGTAISLYIMQHPHKFKTKGIEVDKRLCRPEYRLTFDAVEDYNLHKAVYDRLYKNKAIPLKEVFLFLDDNPEIAYLNKNVSQKNVNLYFSRLKDKPVFTIFQMHQGKYVINDRVGDLVSYKEFIEIVKDRTKWE